MRKRSLPLYALSKNPLSYNEVGRESYMHTKALLVTLNPFETTSSIQSASLVFVCLSFSGYF